MGVAAPAVGKRIGEGRLSMRPLLALLGLSLVLGLVCLVWWSMQPPVLRRVFLRGGGVAVLSAVTHGTVHRYDPVPPLLRLLETLKVGKDLPPPTTVTRPEPEVRLWYSYRAPHAAAAAEGPPILYRFEDEHGCPLDSGSIDDVSAEYNQHAALSWRPSEAIPYGRPFDFCGFYPETRLEAFRFHIEAPPEAPPRPPSQTLEPRLLPQTVVTRDIRVTLKSLRHVPNPEPHYQADIQGFDSRGAPLSAMGLTVTDRYGSGARRVSAVDRRRLGIGDFLFWGLCRKEPAWKLTATFTRNPRPNVTPDAVWDFPSVSLGGKTVTRRRGARTLSARCLPMQPDPGKPERMMVWIESEERHVSSRLFVIKINGQEVRPTVTGDEERVFAAELTPESGWQNGLILPHPTGSSVLELRMAEYFAHEVSFVAAPP